VLLGGVTEFFGSITYIISLSESRSANINLGIPPSITTLFTVFVTALSFACFREHVSRVQIIGIIVVIGAVITISLTGPEDHVEPITVAPTSSVGQGGPKIEVAVTEERGAMFKVVVWSIIVAVTVSIETMVT